LQVTTRVYKTEHDNRFELACLCALLYGYFASVLAGVLAAPSATVNVSVAVCKLAVLLYAAWRVLRRPVRRIWRRGGGVDDRVSSETRLGSEASGNSTEKAHADDLERPFLDPDSSS
jgi:hypothetical protein